MGLAQHRAVGRRPEIIHLHRPAPNLQRMDDDLIDRLQRRPCGVDQAPINRDSGSLRVTSAKVMARPRGNGL